MQDDEDDGPGDAPGDVGKLGLGLAVLAGEGSSALAEGDAQLVLDADALVLAAAGAGVGAVARLPGPEVAGLALAVVRVVGRVEEADGVLVAELELALADPAPVGALVLGDGTRPLGGGVGGAGEALRLLLLWLVEAGVAGRT